MLLIILYIHIHTFKYINCIINCSNVSFLYFFHIKLSCIYTYKIWNILNILLTATLPHIYIYIYTRTPCSVTTYPVCKQLHTLKYINCNIVPYSYFPHVLLLHILHVHLQTYKYIYIYIYTYEKVHLKTHVSFCEQFPICIVKKVVV